MNIHISAEDGKPIYLQIAEQVKFLIVSGGLKSGQELPAVRVLAQRLVVNPNTVVRAYRELEQSGLVVSRHGSGTYVSGAGSPLARKERKRILAERADALLTDARHLGFDFDQVVQLLRERDGQFQEREDE